MKPARRAWLGGPASRGVGVSSDRLTPGGSSSPPGRGSGRAAGRERPASPVQPHPGCTALRAEDDAGPNGELRGAGWGRGGGAEMRASPPGGAGGPARNMSFIHCPAPGCPRARRSHPGPPCSPVEAGGPARAGPSLQGCLSFRSPRDFAPPRQPTASRLRTKKVPHSPVGRRALARGPGAPRVETVPVRTAARGDPPPPAQRGGAMARRRQDSAPGPGAVTRRETELPGSRVRRRQGVPGASRTSPPRSSHSIV